MAWAGPGLFRSWYVNILGQRKRKAHALVAKFVETHNREPTRDELDGVFQRAGADRDFHIFRKGHNEISSGSNIFTDEELVTTAAMVALSAGRSVTILTRDHDVLEQFYMLTGLLTLHYQATLFAERYVGDHKKFIARSMPSSPELRAYFSVDQSLLIEKPVPPDEFVAWLLPEEAAHVSPTLSVVRRRI